jgi:hypothetical protein
MFTKKIERITIKLTIEDKKEIQRSMENGELSDVTRVLLLMYARDPALQVRVRMMRAGVRP